MSSVKEYNIILLGETGTGKSLFINSFANYFHFDDLNEAINSGERVSLISSKFKVTDSNYKDHEITSGKNDGNERTEIGESFTLNCKSYNFHSGDVSVRLIDTPGVGDTHGEEADRANVSNILNYINNFEDLHAIGIVMNNTQTKMTDRFTDCLKLLLTNLNKSAVNNLVFLLTFNNWFKPGPVKEVVEKFFKNELKDCALKLDMGRMYFFDNTSYEYLIATHQGVNFNKDELVGQKQNWRKSSDEMRRLLKHVSELTPHKVRDTVSLNDARQFIKVIHPFLSTVLENINENTSLIIKNETYLKEQSKNITNMARDTSFKQTDIKIVPLETAITFCKSPKCREVIVIEGEEKYHYTKQCCEGCVVGNSFRWWCEAINLIGYCKKCGCHASEHERRFYKTEKAFSHFFTPEAEEMMNKAVSAEDKVKIKIASLAERKAKLLHEKKVIEDAEKKFSKFLQVHAIAKPPEPRTTGNDAAFSVERKVNEKYEKEIAKMECISIDEFYRLKTLLTNLPISGSKIKEILEADAKGLTASVAITHVVKMFLPKKFASLFLHKS